MKQCLSLLFNLLVISCCYADDPVAANKPFTLISPTFIHKGLLPEKCSSSEENCSPEFFWEGAPAGTKSLALVCSEVTNDKDRKVYWGVFNIPPNVDHLQGNVGRANSLPMGAFQIMNDFDKIGYDGPPSKLKVRQKFKFTLYALDDVLSLVPCCTSSQLLRAIQPSEIAHTSMTGYFKYKVNLRNLPPKPY